jgi:hypothetical protein
MPVAQCASPKCGKPFESPKGSKVKFCSPGCRHSVGRRQRRDTYHGKRRDSQRAETLTGYCHDCQEAVNPASLELHSECEGLDTWTERDATCRLCGSPVPLDTPDRDYCGNAHWLAYWQDRLPGGETLTAEQVAHHPDYAVANLLFGFVEQVPYVEVFGTKDNPVTGRQVVDLRKWHDQDREAAADLDKLSTCGFDGIAQ